MQNFFSIIINYFSKLGLYGAFGYDLTFQFEPVELKHPRPEVNILFDAFKIDLFLLYLFNQ